MIPRTSGAPPGKVRPPGAEAGGREDRQQAAASGTSVSTLQRPDDTTREPVHISQCVAEFVNTLLDLGRSCGEIPLYGSPEWAELDRTDPRRFASVVAAAECWRQDGEPDRMRDRLLDELAVSDLLARWRVRMAGLDVRQAVDDWPRVYDVVQARAAAYEAVERTEQPWSPDDLKPTRRSPEPTGLVRGHLQAVR